MGEYDELNDLVRDGSKKLRECKSLSDEALLMHNRPRPVPPYIMSPSNSQSMFVSSSRSGKSPTNSQDVASPSNRKRVLGSTKYKAMQRSSPPKLKGHPRDNGRSNRTRKSTDSNSGSDKAHSSHPNQHPNAHHHYFREQCNFFPGPHSNWAETLGFSVNSLWNCGANNGTMSPTSVGPRSHASSGNEGYVQDPGYSRHGSYHYGYEEARNPSNHGHYEDGYGRSRTSGVRDTAVM